MSSMEYLGFSAACASKVTAVVTTATHAIAKAETMICVLRIKKIGLNFAEIKEMNEAQVKQVWTRIII